MSQYTTGEVAKECGITVRTVQFYDQKGILVPGALTEGGRRLYSEEDLKRMKIICFLRDTGLSLDTIGRLLKEEDPGSVISILLSQQEEVLKDEIAERQEKLNRLETLQKELKTLPSFSIETIGDIANVMENRKKLRAVYRNILLFSLPLTALQWVAIALWIVKGIWWPFAAQLVLGLICVVPICRYYYKKVAYICPQCHEVFRPAFRDFLFSKHTMKTRKLTCVQCRHRGFCVETWGGDLDEKAAV